MPNLESRKDEFLIAEENIFKKMVNNHKEDGKVVGGIKKYFGNGKNEKNKSETKLDTFKDKYNSAGNLDDSPTKENKDQDTFYDDRGLINKSPSKFKGDFVECEKIDSISSSDCDSNENESEMSLLGDSSTKDLVDNTRSFCDSQKDVTDLGIKQSKSFPYLGKRGSLADSAKFTFLERLVDEENSNVSEEIPLNDGPHERKITIRVKKVVNSGQVLTNGALDANELEQKRGKRCCGCCGLKMQLLFGGLCLLVGVLSVIWTPFELLMNERLRMRPGLPAFDWWAVPPDSVFMKMYVFNVTNSDRFLAGLDDKLDMVEYGPITYLEKLEHSNITFNENGTMSYTAKRTLQFLPEQNIGIDLNATITVVNLPVLGFITYVNNRLPLGKMPFNLYLWGTSPKVFRTLSVYDYLWNFTDPIMTTGRMYLPGIVPISNLGVLQTMYMKPVDHLTVYTGTRWGDRRFFTLDNFEGRTRLPNFPDDSSCLQTVQGSTEGLIYSQRLQKNSTLLYWRKTLCKIIELNYVEEVDFSGVNAYRYQMPTTGYYRTHNDSDPDCYAGEPRLLDGLSDISKCFFNFPMALSLPHFYGTPPAVSNRITGFKPDAEKHLSYAIVEPITGIPLESRARSQSNLVIGKLTGFSPIYQKFSEINVPMFWAEYSQQSLPGYLWGLIIIMVKVVPVAQVVFSSLMILVGTILFFKVFKTLSSCQSSFSQHRQLNNLARNTILGYEKEKEKKKESLMQR